jgi:hypothetical protein
MRRLIQPRRSEFIRAGDIGLWPHIPPPAFSGGRRLGNQKLYFAESCNCRIVPAAVTIPNVLGLKALVEGVL